MTKTFEEVVKLFKEQGRTDIIICPEDFNGWKNDKNIKSKFYDFIAKDYFYNIPYKVYKNNLIHPSRLAERKRQSMLLTYQNTTRANEINELRKKTTLERYGEDHPLKVKKFKDKLIETNQKLYGTNSNLQAEEIKEKIKSTNIERYGTKHPMHSSIVKDKVITTNIERFGVKNPGLAASVQQKMKETNLKKYGVEYVITSNLSKEKIKQTLLTKYGVKSVFGIPSVKEKIKQFNIEKYGVEFLFQSQDIRNKLKLTNLEKYGVECPLQSGVFRNSWEKKFLESHGVLNTSQLNARKIYGSMQTVYEWLQKQLEPKPSITTIYRYFQGTNDIYENELLEYVLQFKTNKTTLECTTEKLFGINHFNCKVQNFDKGYRPDFKLSETIYMNVDGLYWHSEKQKANDYHFKMRQDFESIGIRMFQFLEDEIRNKPLIVKSIVNNAIGMTPNKIYARKCIIKKISQKDADIFLKNNHLMGTMRAKHIGLYYNNILVGLISYKLRKNVCKIERFCTLINCNVVGGFSKLLSFLQKDLPTEDISEIHNWVDLRYGTGFHLLEKGFKKTRDTQGWKWTDAVNTFNRLKCRANLDKRMLTEKEYAEELGWYKIYDAGQRLYIKRLTNLAIIK